MSDANANRARAGSRSRDELTATVELWGVPDVVVGAVEEAPLPELPDVGAFPFDVVSGKDEVEAPELPVNPPPFDEAGNPASPEPVEVDDPEPEPGVAGSATMSVLMSLKAA